MNISKKIFNILTIYILYHNASLSLAQDVKTWIADMNFNNAKNWKSGRVPCSKQKVIFSSLQPVAVYMPESLSVSEMVLPLNGELIFPKNAVLISKNNIVEHCDNEDAEFTSTGEFWYNPDNWNITSSRAFPRKSSVRNAAVPHAYQVPCHLDEAWFPEDTTFRVHVIYPTTKISQLVIGSQRYDQENFELLIYSDIGKLLFPDFPRIEISQLSCNDFTGCICGNEAHDILPTICQFTVPCPELECSDPISLVGHCCPICGAKIVAQYYIQFRMDSLMRFFDKYLSTDTFIQVDSFTAKISENSIQSVFIDKTSGNEIANRVADLIYNELVTGTNENYLFGLHSMEIQKSILWKSAKSSYQNYSSNAMSSAAIAAIVILVIVAASLATAFYIYKKRQIPGFSFARFDLRGDKIELELDTTPHEELEPVESSANSEERNQAFDNPVYGTNVSEEAATGSEMEDIIKDNNVVENPMFKIFENTEKESN